MRTALPGLGFQAVLDDELLAQLDRMAAARGSSSCRGVGVSSGVVPRRFSPARSLIFSAVLCVGFLGLLEAGLRVVGVAPPVRPRVLLRSIDVDITFPFMRPDADLFWSPRPGFKGPFLGQPVTINTLGLRGAELAHPKPSRQRRVLCFGDSITFGYGVADDETYAHRLGEFLGGRGVEVANAGVTGYTSHQVLGLLRRLAGRAAPDVATFCVGWNDGTLRPVDDLSYARHVRTSLRVEGLLDQLHIFKAMRNLYLRSVVRGHKAQARRTPRVSLRQYRANLVAIAEMCRQRGIRPVLIGLPHRLRPGEERTRSAYATALAFVGARLNVPVLDPGDLGLHTALPANDEYFIDSLHLSPAGHDYLARRLATQLSELDLI